MGGFLLIEAKRNIAILCLSCRLAMNFAAVESIFSNNPFIDDFMEWMGSPEGQQSIKIDDTLWEAPKNVQLDAKQRKYMDKTGDWAT
jgi:hypothetical protein